MSEIGELIGKSRAVVRNRLSNYGIEIRSPNAPPSPELGEESTLREMYEVEGMPVAAIGRELGHTAETVARWMDKHGIERDRSWSRREYERPSEEELRELYVERGLSAPEIAEIYDCTYGAVYPWLEDYGIERRDADYQPGKDHRMYSGGRTHSYGENWLQQRKAAIERDGGVCVRCGISNKEHDEKYRYGLHVHHISPFSNYEDKAKANRLDNLISLCVKCHATVEGLPIDYRPNS